MGSRSSSENKTVNNVTTYSLQGMESAETVVAGNNNTVYSTDFGAVDAAMELGGDALSANKEIVKESIKANAESTAAALDFGETALESNGAVINKGFGFAEALVQQNTASAASTTLAIKDLAKSLASGGRSDEIELSKQAVYTIGGVVVAVALGLVVLGASK